MIQIVEEAHVDLPLAVGHVLGALRAETGINHRTVIVGHPLHGQHLEYLRNGIEGRHQLSGGLLQPVDFGHHIGVGELPHGAVPAVLQVIVGVVAPALQGFRVVHVARKHVRIEILRELERPVLALAEIVIEIDPLLDNAQTVSQAVVVGFQLAVRNAGEVVVYVAEITRARAEKQRTKSREKICMPAFHA